MSSYVLQKQGDSNRELQVVIQKCVLSELQNILELQARILESLQDPSIFEPTDRAEYIRILEQESVFGCYHQGILIGYLVYIVPGEDSENLGLDINLPAKELQLVGHMDTAVVHADYRGFGIHRLLCSVAETMAKSAGICYLCATVSPKNEASLRNCIAMGYKIMLEKIKYTNKLRYIMMKSI